MNYELKKARENLGLTQQYLAEIVGVTRQTIGLIEQNKYNPNIKLCIKICVSLNKTLDDLF